MNPKINHSINGASDLYEQMIEVKNGRRGFTHISKKQAKEINIDWSFVEQAAELLGLNITRRATKGYSISKAQA